MIYLLFILLNVSSSDNLVEAVIYVESRGCDNAYNAKEDAAGCLQIRPIMVKEVNRLLGSEKYTLKDRWNRDKSIEMFNVIRLHISYPTDEKIARIWNGGWNGHKNPKTIKYWQKVKNRLRK